MSLQSTVIIVSQGRPQSLILTLDALYYQTLPEFEVIVVGGADEQSAIDAAGFSGDVTFVSFCEMNIAAARNAGVAAAQGDIVAFLDDDAVPGPGWLDALTTALISTGSDLAAGYVRGPDGITFQFSGARLRSDASHDPIEILDEDRVSETVPDQATEAMGTNAAYRRAALENVGGFDPAFAYFLDESDLNWRLARAGAQAVISPRAQVVHALAASPRRSADRVPQSLFDIGRSTRVFLDKHFDGDIRAALKMHRAGHEERLLRHLRARRLDAKLVPEILRSFDAGVDAAASLDVVPPDPGHRRGSGRMMRRRDEAIRVECQTNWFGKDRLAYSGRGLWTWNKTRLGRTAGGDSISSVQYFLNAQ